MNTTAASRLIRRLAGLILLAVFGAGQLHGLALLAAAVAALDGEHRVDLAAGRDGVRLVLHHDGVTVQPSGHHHRGLMSVIAGDDDRGPHRDHQLLFSAAGSLAKEQETPVLEVKGPAVSSVTAGSEEIALQPVCLNRSPASSAELLHRWWPPPPAECPWGCVVLLV